MLQRQVYIQNHLSYYTKGVSIRGGKKTSSKVPPPHESKIVVPALNCFRMYGMNSEQQHAEEAQIALREHHRPAEPAKQRCCNCMKSHVDHVIALRFQPVECVVHPKRQCGQWSVRLMAGCARYWLPPEVILKQLEYRSRWSDILVFNDRKFVVVNELSLQAVPIAGERNEHRDGGAGSMGGQNTFKWSREREMKHSVSNSHLQTCGRQV